MSNTIPFPGAPVVRGIDVGYGTTKYISADDPRTREMRCGRFPSLALRVPATDVGAGVAGGRDTVRVVVGSEHFEVGPDAPLLMGRHASHRVLHEGYVTTPEYAALLLGALW